MIKILTFKKLRITAYLLFLFFLYFIVFYILLVNPIIFGISKSDLIIGSSEVNLRNHVEYMTSFEKQRAYKNLEELNKVSSYISDNFKKYNCDEVKLQPFIINETEYKNVICIFKGKITEKIVIGAHYDVYGEYTKEGRTMVFGMYAGADDNASGVAGILELARLIGKNKDNLNNTIEIVAYTLEEPPFFDSVQMGSYVHAKSLKDNGKDIKYMLSIEMIGYFSEEENQEYPVGFLNRIYPSNGNFIAIIGELFDFEIKDVKAKMIANSTIDTWSLSAPKFIPGIDFSDHRNYWNFGYKAYMITDTAFFRNKNYHTAKDTINTLDFGKMNEVVKGIYGILFN